MGEAAVFPSREDFIKALGSKSPVILTFDFLLPTFQDRLCQMLSVVLDELKKPQWKASLTYCLREICTNAQKAVAKRFFFQQSSLDISNPQHYTKGLPLFREAWHSEKRRKELCSQKRKNAFQVLFRHLGDSLEVGVVNSGDMHPDEKARVDGKLLAARQPDWDDIDSVDETPNPVPEEGGGLGIRLISSIASGLGFPEQAFSLRCGNNMTIASLKVPLEGMSAEHRKIHEAIAAQVRALPVFPQQIMKIREMIKAGRSDMHDLGIEVAKDSALTAEILRTVNLAYFNRTQPVKQIDQAVALLGLKGLEKILLSHGARTAMETKFGMFPGLNDHCLKIGTLSRFLAFHHAPGQEEVAFVGGLLHDIGKFILLSQKNSLMRRAGDLLSRGQIRIDVLESQAFGIDHTELGGIAARRWNFPSPLPEMILFHHDPCRARKAVHPEGEVKTLAQIVYFANILEPLAAGALPHYLIDPEIIDFFQLPIGEKTSDFARDLIARGLEFKAPEGYEKR